MTVQELGNRISFIRTQAGLSKSAVAKELNISRPSYLRIEQGTRGIDFTDLLKLCKIFNFSVNDILSENFEYSSDNTPVSFNRDKVESVLLYVLENCAGKPNVGETVIYKLLYFLDFDYYSLHQKSITGLKYRKLPYGPVPLGISQILNDMNMQGKVQIIKTEYHGYLQKRYLPLVKPKRLISPKEKKTINTVLYNLSEMTATKISELSHKDPPWKLTEDMEIIDYNLVRKRKKGRSI